MDMKQHILMALREQADHWEELLNSLNETQITSPLPPSHWSVKDVISHLMAWQQLSIARVEAARLGREPEYPDWTAGDDPDAEDVDQINARIYGSYHEQSWSAVHELWRSGYFHFIEAADEISEQHLLDGGRYPWLKGYPLAYILLASYDHHQEHYEKLESWLQEHRVA